MRHIGIILLLCLTPFAARAQKSNAYYFAEHFVADSASTWMIPVQYDARLFASDTKLALFNNYYANILFYNFHTDSVTRLFDRDVFIVALDAADYGKEYHTHALSKQMTDRVILYKVRHTDRNNNGRIDTDDPAMLYVSDTHGRNLRQITSENENLIDFHLDIKNNFAMLKIQRDADNNKRFEPEDKDYYLVKLDLASLRLGRRIELR